MEQTTDEMDLDEWEYLSDDGFHALPNSGKGLLVSPKLDFNLGVKGVFDMDYFTYHSPKSRRKVEKTKNSSVSRDVKQLSPIQVHLEPKKSEEEVVKEVIKVPILETSKLSPVNNSEKPNLTLGEDQEMISQHVFFKKMKENEFVDIKMDSPKSGGRGIKAQTEAESFQFEDKKEGLEEKHDMGNKASTKVGTEKEKLLEENNSKEVIKWEESRGGFNFLNWGLSGIGALCSLGMAAATICIFILGSQQRHKHQQNQKLRFQIYADDNKRFKQVVHHASKLNQAILSVRGVPFNRAHITSGGYYVYDGL
ncbi:hypothetical protein IFM89_013572 [Coptis chinensis]|uniref:DUF6821 domain-containing protein n=1 Tax=Coptis chinensis TaxID=261450 RepID=A0A835I318_9MAGN|nr:hypothetical protein IFM89_013572 [Coptis chinensis]